MHLLFFPHVQVGETVVFDHETARHLKALRIREGEMIHLTDGKGKRFKASLHKTGKEASCNVISEEAYTPQRPQLSVAIAPTKNHDRLEWFVEKAVEIGVHRIYLIECENSERPTVRYDRLERMAVAALKQSQRYWLPEIFPIHSFKELAQRDFEGTKFLAHCYAEHPKKLLRDVLTKNSDTLICIGPEGDFSREEIYLAEKNGFVSVSLGQSRLRTETAGLAAVHTFELINQN